jgi:hypothetical protein
MYKIIVTDFKKTSKITVMKKTALLAMITALAIFSSCEKNDDNYDNPPAIQSTVVTASGDEAVLATKIDQFRDILGGPVNTTPGNTTGRREINWDGVPATFTNNNTFPLDFFNITDPAGANGRKRGLVYANNGFPIRLDSSAFAEIDPSYADELLPFSKKKALVASNSVHSELLFKVAGTNTDAFIKGFGIIFTDVDDANSTSLEFFNGNKSLGVFKAPVKTANGPFSFLGVHFPEEKITRIKITAGNAAIAPGVKDISDGGTKDLVAYDDLFYDEPKIIN